MQLNNVVALVYKERICTIPCIYARLTFLAYGCALVRRGLPCLDLHDILKCGVDFIDLVSSTLTLLCGSKRSPGLFCTHCSVEILSSHSGFNVSMQCQNYHTRCCMVGSRILVRPRLYCSPRWTASSGCMRRVSRTTIIYQSKNLLSRF